MLLLALVGGTKTTGDACFATLSGLSLFGLIFFKVSGSFGQDPGLSEGFMVLGWLLGSCAMGFAFLLLSVIRKTSLAVLLECSLK